MTDVPPLDPGEVSQVGEKIDGIMQIIHAFLKLAPNKQMPYISAGVIDRLRNEFPVGEQLKSTVEKLLEALQNERVYEYGTVVTVLILHFLSLAAMVNNDLFDKLVAAGIKAKPDSQNKITQKAESEIAKLRPSLSVKVNRMKDDGLLTVTRKANIRHLELAITPQGRKALADLLASPTERQKPIYEALDLIPARDSRK